MSEENIGTVRRILDAFERRDRAGIKAELDADAAWYPALRGLTERSSYIGPEDICRFLLDELDATLEGFRPEVVGEESVGDAMVLVAARFSGQSRSTGLPIEQVLFHLYRLRDRKIIEVRGFTSRDAALEAAGLSE